MMMMMIKNINFHSCEGSICDHYYICKYVYVFSI